MKTIHQLTSRKLLFFLFCLLASGIPVLHSYAKTSRSYLPPCDNIIVDPFIVAGGDDLQLAVTSTTTETQYLTYTTLVWTDYYHPDMYVDYFNLGGTTYWSGNGLDSPTSVASNVNFPGLTSATWNLDFDGYGNLFGETHTIGPFSVTLVFDDSCEVTGNIPLVEVEIIQPVDGQVISSIENTRFEALAWDTGVGTNNGDGIDMVHLVLLDPSNSVVINQFDTSAPFCVFGNANPCPTMSPAVWDSLPDGSYTLIAWARSGVTQSWSAPHQITFMIDRASLTSTPTGTSTMTLTPTFTPSPTDSLTPTPTQSLTSTEQPPTATETSTPTQPAPQTYQLYFPVVHR